MKTLRWFGRIFVAIFVLYILPVGGMVAAHYADNGARRSVWSHSHDSTNQTPTTTENEAVIQVYAARAARWRGAIGVHTWFAVKRTDESRYTRLEVIGYNVYWGGRAVRIRSGSPDSRWFGNDPVLLREIRGNQRVDALIDKVYAAADRYPYDDIYHVWPGPNSNTFIAWLARAIPELRLELPSNAVGKDYLPGGSIAARTPSGTGVQLSLGGYAGLLAGLEEGLEVNVLGLTAGVDLWPPALKLPGVGRIGFADIRKTALSD